MTVAYNYAGLAALPGDQTRGAGIQDFAGGGTFSVRNSIIALNGNHSWTFDCLGGIESRSHNLLAFPAKECTVTGDTTGNLVGPPGPLLGPFQSHGGPTLMFALLEGSIAVDAGDNAGCPATDQRGYIRPADGNGDGSAICDMGAYELGATSKDDQGDTDGDTVPNGTDADDDNDGCTDEREAWASSSLGGMRGPHNFWDFFDVPAGVALTRDGDVTGLDIFAVLARFNATDAGPGDFNRNSDPLSTPNAAVPGAFRANYHPAYDRGALIGSEPWDRGPPDGAVTGSEVFTIIAQFGHSCS